MRTLFIYIEWGGLGAAPVIKSRALELLRGVWWEFVKQVSPVDYHGSQDMFIVWLFLGSLFPAGTEGSDRQKKSFTLVWWASESYWRWGYLLRHGHMPQTKTFLSITVNGLQIYWERRGLVCLVRILLCILSADALGPDLIRVLLQEITAAEIWTRQLQQCSLQNGVGS